MSSKAQQPYQAERLEDVHLPDSAPNGLVQTLSKQSDEHVLVGEKSPQAPERSKGKVTLIMGSLMVRDTLRVHCLAAKIADERFRSLSFLLLLIL